LEKLVEKATGKAISTALARTSNDEIQGSELTQMSGLLEEMNNLNLKFDATLKFATLLRSYTI